LFNAADLFSNAPVIMPRLTGSANVKNVNSPRKVLFLGMALFGVTVAAVPFSTRASAQARPQHAVATNLPGVYAYTQPPAGFDPATASKDELESWGYPPRPGRDSGPEALKRWSLAVSPSLRRVVPDLVRREGVYHRPARGLKVTSRDASGKAASATSSNWSGYALVPGAGAQPFYYVTGRWTVPTVKQAPGTCSGGWDYSSHWVGLGGFTDAFLLQAGSEADVFCDIGSNIPEYFPWFEWLPAPELVLYQNAAKGTLFPFSPGDYLIVVVWATNFSAGVSTAGHVQFSDITQGWGVNLAFSAASVGGSRVTGKSAEWIVERTEVGSILGSLPDYTANPWVATAAVDLASKMQYPGLPSTSAAYNITMLDDSSKPVSFVDLFGEDALWFFPEGSAVK
jgi:hypothetical protein